MTNPAIKDDVKAEEKKKSSDEIVSVQFIKTCCKFQAGPEGRPQQITYNRGACASFRRDELKEIILLELVKSRDAAQQRPQLFIILGQ